MKPLRPGSKVGPYEIVGSLGEGGMGVVYRARDPRLGREVAIKFLPGTYAADPARLSRFEREARAAAALNHPNVLAVYDVDIREGAPYLVTELLDGRSLRESLDGGPLPWREAVEIACGIARGLVAAHDKGIVHRDLKPENVFVLADGRAKILDFGLATFAPDTGLEESVGASSEQTLERLTVQGVVVGTVGYMAPEQVAGRSVDGRCDLFALGVMLHEMLSGSAPFRRETRIETLHAILKEQPPALEWTDGDQPERLASLVLHCLEKNPARRFQTARDLLFELTEVAARPGGVQRPNTGEAASRRPVRLVIGAALVAGVALAVSLWTAREGDRSVAPPSSPDRVAIAVLPFEERGSPSSLDYLGLGLPDEIATALTYAKGVTVRPFTESSRFAPPRPALPEIGTELEVNHLVLGQFGIEGDQVSVSVEAIGLVENRIVWRDSWSVSRGDLRAVRTLTRERISSGLLPALGREGAIADRARPLPGSPEAYDLYLQAQAISHDPLPNLAAIELLERSVELDPGFASAWLSLGQRLRLDAVVSRGEGGGFARAVEAVKRAAALDPDLLPAQLESIGTDVELGQTAIAYRAASRLVRQRTDSAEAHATLGFALRVGGAFEQSARECRIAWSLDPGGEHIRRCFWSLVHVGDFESALNLLDVGAGLEIVESLRADVLMRMGDDQGALEAMAGIGDDLAAIELQRGCIQDPRPEGLAAIVGEHQGEYIAWRDPEAYYWLAALLARCELPDFAFRFLELAIDGSYCATAALDNDPLWDGLRTDPRFLEQRARASACHGAFLEAGGMTSARQPPATERSRPSL